ncbi:MAG: hypothetical protein WKF37_00130 [Bryobacteraceae bacterium]
MFLTGSQDQVNQAASLFGVLYWPEDGAITHTSRTVLIGRDGRLLAIVEGSAFRTINLYNWYNITWSKRMKLPLTCLLASALFAADAPNKSPDLCVPPPGAVAPSLPAKLLKGQGQVKFSITTKSPEAQKFFEQGVAQMHSFWAREAERSFLQAAQLDPEAPMPWWGVAMVATGDYRPRFQLDGDNRSQSEKSRALTAARKAQELAAVPGKATDLEKLYIVAIAERRQPGRKDPDKPFVRALRQLLDKYPSEVEARTYLALSIMRGFTLPDKKPRNATSTEAVAILRDLIKTNPDHPGVHHYVIHGWEGSTFAADAWPSCKRYAELVDNIPHALHMPGHIYSQTAKWNEAIESFESAAQNERSYMKADSLYGNQHHGHNVHYLATVYAFSGQFDKAVQASRGLMGMKENPREQKQLDNVRTAYTQGWYGLLRTLAQFEKWDAILDGTTVPEPSKPLQKAWYHWARAIAFAHKADATSARAEAAKFALVAKPLKRDDLKVGHAEIEGQIAIALGKSEKGLQKLAKASISERRLRYFEPPLYPRPVAESLGHHAAKLGKREIAEKAFRAALEQFPGDFHAETGLRALGKTATEAGL